MIRLLLSLALLCWSSTTFAHHPFDADYDRSRPVTLRGTVSRLSWSNPHAFLYVDVKDGKGGVIAWTVELGAVDDLVKHGWKMDSVTAGAQVTVEGWRAKDGSTTANAKSIRLANGPTLSAGSSFDTADNSATGAKPNR